MKKKQKLKERICALVLALAMVLTWVLPDAGMTVQAAGGTEVEYTVSVTDEDGALADVSVSAQTGDTAAVTAKTGQNGKATLTLTKDAEYTVTLAKEGYETHTANVTPTEQNTQMNQKLRFKPFTITASDSTIAGQNVTLQIANPVAGVSYQWTANGASAAPTSGTGTSFNITCAAAGTVNVTAAAKGQTASKSIIVNKKTINTSDISISLDPDQGAVNKISVTVAGFPADAEGQVTLQYSYQGSTYTKTASKTKDITSVVIVLNAEQDVFFGKLNCTVSYANDALYNDFSGVNKDAVYRKTHELTSEQKIELDTDNDGKKEEVYGQEITYGECIDKTVELKAEDVKDRVVTYSFDENDTESQNIVTISEDGKISLKEDGHSGTAKVIVKAAETDDYAAAQMEYYIVAKPKAITVDVSKNLTVKDASKVYDGSADITVGAVVDGTLLVNGDDGTNAEKDVLEIEGVKGTLWNTTEDDADPSTVSNEVKITADSFKEAELSSKWYEITYKGENVFEGKTTVTRRTLYFGTSDIADCNYELDMFNEIQSAQAKVVTLNKDADVKDNGFVSGENAENTGIEIPHPEVEFFDIEDKSANNGTVAPGVKYSDVNYMESGVDITIKGAKHDKTELSGNRTNIANGESIKMEDFKHDEETDDVYTMTAVIKDKAGNETEKEVMFSVNRFGSNYIFSETTEKFLDDVYANKPKDLVVTEVNVDSLVFNGISYGLDGTKKELKPGSDYTVKQSGGEGSWKEYTYTIKKENFEKEGRYSVTIDSEDKATNKMNNKVKECNIDFVIDKTPPTVVITGIEESSYRADEREMTINLSDNTAVKSVDVIIDGRSVATYAQKEIEKAGGKISYMIEGASEPQKIEAAALDMAGNETTSEMHKVLVTSSVWIQYINNTPLLIGSILGIVLVAGGLIWFFVIRKKKEESK